MNASVVAMGAGVLMLPVYALGRGLFHVIQGSEDRWYALVAGVIVAAFFGTIGIYIVMNGLS